MTHEPPDEPRVLPASVRYPIIVVLLAVGAIGLVVAVYDKGWLPLAGPFVAVVVAGAIVFVVMWWRSRRLRRLSATAADQLRALGPAIVEERGRAYAERPTGASDTDLEQADERAGAALQRLAWGDEQGATAELVGLADAARSWRPEAQLSQQVEDLARTSAEMDQVVRRMTAAAERRRR